MDFLERKYVDKGKGKLRLRDMVRVSPLDDNKIDLEERASNKY